MTHGVGILSAYIQFFLNNPAYPKPADCCDRTMVSLLTMSITSARIFVAVWQGANDDIVLITVSASSYVTFSAEMFSTAALNWARLA